MEQVPRDKHSVGWCLPFGVHGDCVSGGADDKEDMIWAIIKVVGFIIGLLAVAVVLESFNGFVLDNMWVK